MNRLWLLPLLASLALPCAAATLYSWTDANGTQHFSDVPPPEQVKAKAVKIRGENTLLTGSTEGNPNGADANGTSSAKKSGPALARAAGYSLEDIDRNCKTAQHNMSILQAQKDAQDSNQAPVDPETAKGLAAQMDKATQQIQLFCGAPQEGGTP